MLLFQRDFYYLNRFFNMSQKSGALAHVFNSLYWPWVGQLRLTGAMGGIERGYQSFIEKDIETRGFGLSFLRKKSQARKKKQLTDYLHPDEEQNVYE